MLRGGVGTLLHNSAKSSILCTRHARVVPLAHAEREECPTMRPTRSALGIVHYRAAGFSLVELLVAVTIIGILIALLLPAVQAARESARRLQCGNNVRQLALAALSHESVVRFFPTGGWNKYWLGHPDRGFDKRQPGGWITMSYPFIEQQSLHDLGACSGNVTIQDANATRCAQPLAGLNCPSRRPAALYRFLAYGIQFTLTNGTITQLARNDYAMNGGDYVQWRTSNPQWLPDSCDRRPAQLRVGRHLAPDRHFLRAEPGDDFRRSRRHELHVLDRRKVHQPGPLC